MVIAATRCPSERRRHPTDPDGVMGAELEDPWSSASVSASVPPPSPSPSPPQPPPPVPGPRPSYSTLPGPSGAFMVQLRLGNDRVERPCASHLTRRLPRASNCDVFARNASNAAKTTCFGTCERRGLIWPFGDLYTDTRAVGLCSGQRAAAGGGRPSTSRPQVAR